MVPIRARNRIAWLLPVFFARLFVPPGFMLSPSEQGLGIALCPDYALLPVPVASAITHNHNAGLDHGADAMDGGIQEPDGSRRSGHDSQGQTECPFALVGGTASCPVNCSTGELPRLVDTFPNFHLHPDWITPAVLIDRIRGPPLA